MDGTLYRKPASILLMARVRQDTIKNKRVAVDAELPASILPAFQRIEKPCGIHGKCHVRGCKQAQGKTQILPDKNIGGQIVCGDDVKAVAENARETESEQTGMSPEEFPDKNPVEDVREWSTHDKWIDCPSICNVPVA